MPDLTSYCGFSCVLKDKETLLTTIVEVKLEKNNSLFKLGKILDTILFLTHTQQSWGDSSYILEDCY